MSTVHDVLEAHPEVALDHTTIFGTDIYVDPHHGCTVMADHHEYVAVMEAGEWVYLPPGEPDPEPRKVGSIQRLLRMHRTKAYRRVETMERDAYWGGK